MYWKVEIEIRREMRKKVERRLEAIAIKFIILFYFKEDSLENLFK